MQFFLYHLFLNSFTDLVHAIITQMDWLLTYMKSLFLDQCFVIFNNIMNHGYQQNPMGSRVV